MQLRAGIVAVLGILVAVQNLSAQDSERGMIPVTYVEQGPTIDGKLDDACWQKAKEVTGFVALADGKTKAKLQTFVRGVYDQHCLYLSFRCEQPGVKAAAHQQRDGALWFDDCIELFISPHISSTLMATQMPEDQHFHLIVNSAGDQFDELGSAGPASWNGDWKDQALVTPEGWQVEIAIPFASLYFENFENRKNPPEMTVWHVQFGRSAGADGAYSTLFPGKGMYKTHAYFGDLVFVSDPNDKSIRWKLDEQSVLKPRVATIEKSLTQMQAADNASLRGEVNLLTQKLANFKKDFAALKDTAYLASTRKTTIARLETLERSVLDVQATAVSQKAAKLGNKVAVGSHLAIKDATRIYPDSIPALDEVGSPVRMTTTPGEYEAASLVIWNEKPVSDLMINVGPLTSGSAALPPTALDARWVKCWYQAGDADIIPIGNFLIPELLLKNPDMVTVDRVNKKNIMLDGYVGDPTGRGYRDDSKELLPIKQLDAKTSTQVWLTAHVPEGTPPGTYKGTVTITGGSETLATLPIEVRVLGFNLSRSMLENNWYAQTGWGNRKWITEERALVEIRNLVAHGVDYVGMVENLKGLPSAIHLMQEGGMKTDKIYATADGGDSSVSLQYTTPASASQMAKDWVSTAKQSGCENVYMYLIDEGREDALKGERAFAEAMRAAGVKTWVACYSNYFDLGGSFIDLANIANGPVAPELVKKIHDAGKKVFSYANPQGGVERPEVYRRNYGLLLWQHDYDGSFDWCWYWQFGPAEGPQNAWDDFNWPVYRDHMMVYPTKTGLVDTIQWEGWREGVDDTRYVATLMREIDAAKQRGQTKVADDADAWLKELKNGGTERLGDLDAVRADLIKHIEECQAAK